MHSAWAKVVLKRVFLTFKASHMYRTIEKHKLRQCRARHASCFRGDAIHFLHLIGTYITAFQEILAGQISAKTDSNRSLA